jgi:3-hydroxyisobutyrate dehydrogenase-like beta-hydroxyacid dehydrogenase
VTTNLDVGVIGLGAMGSRIARRLLSAGYRVHGWNRSAGRVAPLAAQGLIPWSTPREVAEHADIVLTMLWDSAALRDVTLPPDGLLAGLRARSVYVDMSTVEPKASAEVSREAASRGAAMLDCPVSGSLDAAESGNLVLLASGPAHALDRARPVLEHLGRHIAHLGEEPGLGLALKLAINLQVAIQEVAWGEGLIVAERAGISRGMATEVMLASVIASPMLRYRAPFVLSPPDEVWASASQLRKDVDYALEYAADDNAENDKHDKHAMPAGRVALSLLHAVCNAGEADEEAAALARFVADRRSLSGARP